MSETEPMDPFSEEPSKKISLKDLKEIPFIKSVYGAVTSRTFFRELLRLQELGFIRFSGDGKTPGNIIIELDFTAIGKY